MSNQIRIIRIPISTPTLYPNTETNSYLIGNEEESLLVDAGYDQVDTIREVEKAIQDHDMVAPKRILLTHYHPDHAPGVRQLQHFSPTVLCHQKELEQIKEAIHPLTHIQTVHDGENIQIDGVNITIIHGPGHTAGHLSLYIPSEKVLLSGDNIVSDGTTWIGAPDGDMRDYLQTLNRLKQFDMKKIGPGHGDWVLNPYEKIDFVMKRRLKRESQIKELLKDKQSLSSEQLTTWIYKDQIHPSVFEVAKKTIEAHLVKLQKDGLVQNKNGQYSLLNT
ncbi:MBL fold metallo-hydrolase [Salinibacillus xinjiangensis]|uniref:MBL fold metallo-hydrolase n=1 Tax=Salinibacillus xinjiangensis TaxID=1229268 RepID=UPI001890BBBF|nr:MBL fold metallo-hydrolase [Salinibacillus xinjiangensis]